MSFNTIRVARVAALLATSALSGTAYAQVSAPDAPPTYVNVDENGVDLATGKFAFSLTEGVIGAGDGAIEYRRIWQSGGFFDNWSSGLFSKTVGTVTTWYVELGDYSDTFTQSGSTFTNTKGNGATLQEVSGAFKYTSADGSVVDYKPATGNRTISYACPTATAGSECYLPSAVTKPNGMKFVIRWDLVSKCDTAGVPIGDTCDSQTDYYRFKGVTSSAGYAVNIAYATSTPGAGTSPVPDWTRRTGASFSNSVTLCTSECPSAAYTSASGIVTVSDALNRTWRFDQSTTQLTGIRKPGSSSDDVTVSYTGAAIVSQVVKDGLTFGYARSVSGNVATTIVTTPTGTRVVTADMSIGRVTSFKDELNHTTSYTYWPSGLVKSIIKPEGNHTDYTYDARGNLIQTSIVPKSGSSLATITTSASFPCSVQKACNKPETTTDERGQVTNYTYDPTHGGLLSVTRPAPSNGAVRPQSRYSYTLVASPVSGHGGAYLTTGISVCQSTASCVGTADEVKTTIGYGNNMLTTSISNGAGNGSLTVSNAATYDAAGNLLTSDGPLTGSSDTIRYRYDAERELVGTVSADPDGAGPMKSRAQRVTYNPLGHVTRIEVAAVADQSDPAWSTFSPAEAVDIVFDAHGRKVRETLSAGGSILAASEYSYDAAGRLDCTARRMNSASFTSLTGAACSVGSAGSFGADRVTKRLYDAIGRVTDVQEGVGSAIRDTIVKSFTNNGLISTITDAEGNTTTYSYDGVDRISKVAYPLPTKGSRASSNSDYEQITYDLPSNVVTRRLRDGQSIAYGYDNLGRLTSKNLPGSEPNSTYGYDSLDRLTSASQPGSNLTFTYDALGRNQDQIGPLGTVSSQYELDGARKQITYPGSGLTVNIDHLVTGEVSKIRENGATSGVGVLATYAYDDLGRRSKVTYGNGLISTYGYDAASRLSSIAQSFPDTAKNLSIGLTYNPVSQIATTSRSNEQYAFPQSNAAPTFGTNGLNQLTDVAGVSTAFDMRGNMTSDTVRTYGYSSENLLTSVQGGTSLGYDPLTRLFQIAGTSTSRFAYDNDKLIAEYDGAGTLLRRFVHGAGTDEPIVWYEGAGTSDRRFLERDERGSVVSVSDSSGVVTNINSYDEFGKPAASNVGRFGFTGQISLPEIGLNYFKARMYNPLLGRFMQPDPAGFAGGPNAYAYAGNDPVSFADPSGLCRDASGKWFEPIGGSHICPTDASQGGGNPGSQYPPAVVGGGGGGQKWFVYCANCGLPAEEGPNGEIIINAPILIWIPLSSSSGGENFACVGGSTPYALLAGLCFTSKQHDVYLYGGIGVGALPVDVTIGHTFGPASEYLSGLSVSANGLPGAGISYTTPGWDPSGWYPSAMSVQTGTPGAAATYGVNISEPTRQGLAQGEDHVDTFLRGAVNWMYAPVIDYFR